MEEGGRFTDEGGRCAGRGGEASMLLPGPSGERGCVWFCVCDTSTCMCVCDGCWVLGVFVCVLDVCIIESER